MIHVQYISFVLICKALFFPALSDRMFQTILQHFLEGSGTGERGLDQEPAAAVDEGIAVHLPRHIPDALGRRERGVDFDGMDIRHRVRIYGTDVDGLDSSAVMVCDMMPTSFAAGRKI